MTTLDGAADGSVAAHAAQARDGSCKLIVLNKSLHADATLSLHVPGAGRASVLRLTAPRPDDTTDVTFGGAVVREGGAWTIAAPPRDAKRKRTRAPGST